MTQTISRMYATHAQAKQAFDEFKELGYEDVHLFAGAQPGGEGSQAPTPSRDSILSALTRAYILKQHASIYADRISTGSSLVTVHALFGTALKARQVLDGLDPIDSGVPDPVYPSYAWDQATPFSSALQLPVLTKTKLPFEKMWNLPSVTRRPSFFSNLFGLPLLSKAATPFSRSAGWPLLSRLPTPFSSKLGMPLLTKP